MLDIPKSKAMSFQLIVKPGTQVGLGQHQISVDHVCVCAGQVHDTQNDGYLNLISFDTLSIHPVMIATTLSADQHTAGILQCHHLL